MYTNFKVVINFKAKAISSIYIYIYIKYIYKYMYIRDWCDLENDRIELLIEKKNIYISCQIELILYSAICPPYNSYWIIFNCSPFTKSCRNSLKNATSAGSINFPVFREKRLNDKTTNIPNYWLWQIKTMSLFTKLHETYPQIVKTIFLKFCIFWYTRTTKKSLVTKDKRTVLCYD